MNRDEGGLLRMTLRTNGIADLRVRCRGPFFGVAPIVLGALGLGFVAFGAHAWIAAGKTPLRRAEAVYFVVADTAYAVASAAVLLFAPQFLTVAGRVVFGLMADVVFLFAIGECLGMWRLTRVVPATA